MKQMCCLGGSLLCLSPRDSRDLLHIVISFVLSPGVPILINFALDAAGFEPTALVYTVVIVFLLVMACLIITECCMASYHKGTPEEYGAPPVRATAIICAFMPNEQHTIMETVNHFLSIDYEPGLQTILAYNTPKFCPVEDELIQLAQKNANFLLLKVETSTSKAENLNAALDYVDGEFIGMFDADHCPDHDSFHRAWKWLSNGYGVVQGHCLVRNPEESFWAKMVAIEFETIYAVAHPGRYLKDQFGVFGGSNGYWKTDLLKRIGMKGSMLTEDIDSSMRVLEEGKKIGADPKLISRELATTTARQVWNQRLRWAQGWTQVSMQHCFAMMTNKHFSLRQKFGAFMLLFIREIYPWISMQIMTLIIYWWIKGHQIYWLIPLFVATTILTFAVGPITILVTYNLCHESLRNKWWFLQYAIFSAIFYTEAKNVIARVAHIKEWLGESGWRVTPRSAKAVEMEIESVSTTPENKCSRGSLSSGSDDLDLSVSSSSKAEEVIEFYDPEDNTGNQSCGTGLFNRPTSSRGNDSTDTSSLFSSPCRGSDIFSDLDSSSSSASEVEIEFFYEEDSQSLSSVFEAPFLHCPNV